MSSGQLSRLSGLATCRVQDRAAADRYLRDLRSTIADLRAQLDRAQQRLAVAEARALCAESAATRVRSMLFGAHEQIARERREAELVALAAIDAAETVARGARGAPRADRATLVTMARELRRSAVPASRALDFMAGHDGAAEPSWPPLDYERMAAS